MLAVSGLDGVSYGAENIFDVGVTGFSALPCFPGHTIAQVRLPPTRFRPLRSTDRVHAGIRFRSTAGISQTGFSRARNRLRALSDVRQSLLHGPKTRGHAVSRGPVNQDAETLANIGLVLHDGDADRPGFSLLRQRRSTPCGGHVRSLIQMRAACATYSGGAWREKRSLTAAARIGGQDAGRGRPARTGGSAPRIISRLL